MTTIALTYDLRDDYLARGFSEEQTAEFDRADTIDAIEQGLSLLGYRTVRVGNVYDLMAALSAGARWDLVFNICEGLHGFGRESLVPALLDHYRIPYVFSDPLTLAVTLHKGVAKRVVRDQGVPTPDFLVVERIEEMEVLELPAFPLFVKPVAEGTGKGVASSCLVGDMPSLNKRVAGLLAEHEQPVLVESYLPGREVTVGIIGTGDQARVVGVMDIVLRNGADPGCYTYRNKEECESLVEYRAVRGAESEEPSTVALDAYRALGVRDTGRVDLRQDAHGRYQFMEVNPLPGMHPEHSDLPILCTLNSIGYQDLLAMVMESVSHRIAGVGSPRRKAA
ncbi:MAG: D-alanine--D-alanine ligase family protein [Oceanidesulfovibrio sp.]